MTEKRFGLAVEKIRELLLPFDSRCRPIEPTGYNAFVCSQLASQVRLCKVAPFGPLRDEVRASRLLVTVNSSDLVHAQILILRRNSVVSVLRKESV